MAMAREVDGRRRVVRWVLAALLVTAGGCSSGAPITRQADLGRLEPMHDVDNRPDVGPFGRVRELFSGQKAGLVEEGP